MEAATPQYKSIEWMTKNTVVVVFLEYGVKIERFFLRLELEERSFDEIQVESNTFIPLGACKGFVNLMAICKLDYEIYEYDDVVSKFYGTNDCGQENIKNHPLGVVNI